MHSQMASSFTLDRRSFIDPWSDAIQRPTTQDPANVTIEAAAEEPMDISRPASPPVANLLHDGVIEEAFSAVAQTETPINASAEEPPIVGAYPGSPVRSVVLSPWEVEVVDELPQLGRLQQQDFLCQPQGQQLGNTSPGAERTSPSSIIVEASESSEQLAEDVASDIDADGEADVDPAPVTNAANTGVSAPLQPGPFLTPAVTVVPQPLNTHAPAGPSANAASGITIDARLTSLDEALVNLWVRAACPILVLYPCAHT
jgi:hypothetical protein